jgi:heme exporter protein A
LATVSPVADPSAPAGATGAPAIYVAGLWKRFARRPVLRDLHLQSAAGSVTVLFGPNGAGKTTLLRVLAGLVRPDAGRVCVAGCWLPADRAAARPQVGFLSHQPLLYGDLTVEENLRFYARLFGLPDAQAAVEPALDLVALSHRRRELVRTLSRGLQQRAALARAVLHRPAVLLLDEPDTGLDEQALDILTAILRSACRTATGDHTVLMTTHNLERGLALADRALVLYGGCIVGDWPASPSLAGSIRALYRAGGERP